MNELLQKHGCANVFSIPEGLKELMADITREVLRDQPPKILDYITNYLSVLLITREHGVMAVKILDDLCDCRPSVSEHLIQLGMDRERATALSDIIKEEVEGFEPVEGKEKVKEVLILKRILCKTVLDEEMTAKLCQIIRNAYRDYWYRKKLMQRSLKVHPEEPWEIAAERTLEIYKRTKPSYSELTRATQKIQAAYRGYYVRRNILRHLKPKKKKTGPKVEMPGPPIDVADSREIDLGPVINQKFRDEDTTVMFKEVVGEKLGLRYDPMKTLTHVEDPPPSPKVKLGARKSDTRSRKQSVSMDVYTSREDLDSDSRHKRRSPVTTVMTVTPVIPKFSASSQELSVPNVSSHKISFSQKPVEVFELEEPAEIPEDISAAASEAGEIDAQEVPEDIPDDPIEGDESVSTSSVSSSATHTANSTDVEYAAEMVDDDEAAIDFLKSPLDPELDP